MTKTIHDITMSVEIQNDSIHIQCSSSSHEVRALEFLDYIIGEEGTLHGDMNHAEGSISPLLLSMSLEGSLDTISDNDKALLLFERGEQYFNECDLIYSYADLNGNTDDFSCYYKKKIPWAYVAATDVLPLGTRFQIKTLETTTGVESVVTDSTYIMIGVYGEVYPIEKDTFHQTYEPSKDSLDIFNQMMDFIPAIETIPEGDYLAIDTYAHLCYPKKGSGIRAKALTKRTKVFPDRNKEYYVGKPGDYLVTRLDNKEDIYIIQKNIFLETYTMSN